LNCDIIEIRLSLNGVTEGFLFTLFRLLDNEPNQILIKRINDPRFSLTSDDLILEGVFSQQFIKIISNFYPFIQSFKISSDLITESIIDPYAAKTWIAKDITLYSGVTLLPQDQVASFVNYESPDHFVNLLISSQAGSVLNPLLAIKPKGIIAKSEEITQVVYPARRLDLIIEWFNKIISDETSIDWISGSTGELAPELASSIGDIDQNKLLKIDEWLEATKQLPQVNVNRCYRYSMRAIS
jgi:hypothetical protein